MAKIPDAIREVIKYEIRYQVMCEDEARYNEKQRERIEKLLEAYVEWKGLNKRHVELILEFIDDNLMALDQARKYTLFYMKRCRESVTGK